MCSGSVANISCGFVNANPNNAVPNWRIVRRNADSSVMSNMSVAAIEITTNTNDGLEWYLILKQIMPLKVNY